MFESMLRNKTIHTAYKFKYLFWFLMELLFLCYHRNPNKEVNKEKNLSCHSSVLNMNTLLFYQHKKQLYQYKSIYGFFG